MQFVVGDSANPVVTVSRGEYEALADLVCAAPQSTNGLALLWQELDRAVMTDAPGASADVVRMGSQVHFTDYGRRETRMAILAYPQDAVTGARISVTSVIGAALLGLRAGDEFRWRKADGQVRALRIEEVRPPLRPFAVQAPPTDQAVRAQLA